MKPLALLSALASLCLAAQAAATIVGTYNIRYDNPGDVKRGDSWPQRVPVIANLIRFHNFDLLGTQEGFPHQMEDLRKLLPEYDCASYGRDDGAQAGEHAAIFFKKDKYELLDSGRFWLSENPDQPGPGWDASLPRLCSWAKLHTRTGDKTCFVFCLHLDHRGPRSRHEAIQLVLKKIGEIAGGETTFLLGDFNTDQNSESYRLLTGSDRFVDAIDIAAIRHAVTGTANGFNPNLKTDSRIDHIFVPKGTTVRRYGILTDTYRVQRAPNTESSQSPNFPVEVKFQDYEARLPSDHFPVLIEVDD